MPPCGPTQPIVKQIHYQLGIVSGVQNPVKSQSLKLSMIKKLILLDMLVTLLQTVGELEM
jgi:hypothetical protein